MKGLICAGGRGTRLLPATRVTNKHMIPILNRPMIMYPLETLIENDIRDILIIAGGDHIGDIAEFLGDGSEFGVSLTYKVQGEAGGIAQAVALGEEFFRGEERVNVILGDNIFAPGVKTPATEGAAIWVKEGVRDSNRFGVLRKGKIIEKPRASDPKDRVITGFYSYPSDVFDIIRGLRPSRRGELEISDVNRAYLNQGRLRGFSLTSDTFWSDAGTPDSLKSAIDWAHRKLSTG